MASEIHPQLQSSLLTRLPREILDKIYLELWRSYGLRQHILFHGRDKGLHFCRWECCTEYQVDDPLQADIEKLRVQLNVPLGMDIRGDQPPEIRTYCRRLMSPWMNHWPCGERATQEHGIEAISGYASSGTSCWKTWRDDRPYDLHVPSWSPYLPMLLTCRLVSAQCLKSIYESITFIFTDLNTIQAWFGYCQLRPEWEGIFKGHSTPPAFHKYMRSFELSLNPDFGRSFICGNMMFYLPKAEHPHDGYDFHWLYLSRFSSLRTVNIWVGARSKIIRIDEEEIVLGIKELDMNALAKSLSSFANIKSMTISTPLGSSFEPEDGLVKGFAIPNVRLYKRGPGDRFHSWMNIIHSKSPFGDLIHTCRTRQVRLAINGGNHHVMREV